MRFSVILVLCLVNSHGFSQNIIRAGLFRAQLTLSVSNMLSENQSSFYLHGNLEGYASERLSLSGEGYHYLGGLSSKSQLFKTYESFFFGASWHFTKGNHDLYIGLQPGIAIAQLSESENFNNPTHLGTSPLFSSVVGYNFFVNKIFHFFIQTRIVEGQHLYDVRKNLNELRISGGLGFNINSTK